MSNSNMSKKDKRKAEKAARKALPQTTPGNTTQEPEVNSPTTLSSTPLEGSLQNLGLNYTTLPPTAASTPPAQAPSSIGVSPSNQSLVSADDANSAAGSQVPIPGSGSGESDTENVTVNSGKAEDQDEKKDARPIEPFLQDSNDISGNFLLANYFSISAGNYRTLYRYTLGFQRRETPKERERREAKDPKDPKNAFLPVGDDTYVDINPARPKRRRIVRLLVQALSGVNIQIPIATDYFEQVITAKTLRNTVTDQPTQSSEWVEYLDYYDEYEIQPPANPERFRVTVSGPTALNLDQFRTHLSTAGVTAYAEKEDTIRALNIIFSYRPYEQCFFTRPDPTQPDLIHPPKLTTKNGTKFHSIAKGIIQRQQSQTTATGMATWLDPGIVTITGFSRSVRPNFTPNGLIALNVNTATSIFYQRVVTLQELINNWRQDSGNSTPIDQKALSKLLKNIRVRTTYLPGQENYIGRVTGVADPHSGQEPCPTHCQMHSPQLTQNQHGTVLQYFRNQNFLPFLSDDPRIIVVNVGEGDGLETIPATHLNVILGQVNRNTNLKPEAGVITPLRNKDLVFQARDMVLGAGNDELGPRQFQLTLASELLKVPTTRLKTPRVQYRTPATKPQPYEKILEDYNSGLNYGSWNLRGMNFVNPAKQKKWTYVVLRLPETPECPPASLDTFVKQFGNAFNFAGMTDFKFIPLGTYTDHHTSLPFDSLPGREDVQKLKQQEEVIEKVLRKLESEVNLVMILLPSKNQDLYGCVKRAGDQTVGMTTVCHVTKIATTGQKPSGLPEPSGNVGTLANISMKVNLKVSPKGVNQSLNSAQRGPILTAKSMIIGIDVTHPGSAAMKDSPSIAAVVGSVDEHFAQWPASLERQMPIKDPQRPDLNKQSVEQVLQLRSMVCERIREYRRENGASMPDKIIVYRDGLSEEQFDMCVKKEYPEIVAAIDDAMKNPPSLSKPKVLIICAVKRHNTRCFPAVNTESAATDSKMFICNGPPDSKAKPIENEKDFNWNPMPGTLITKRITQGLGKDFFLYSQNAIKGTARPAHYVILKDGLGKTKLEDVAQMVSHERLRTPLWILLLLTLASQTHNLSYLFGRATRSTGVCAPVYYADLAADRARFYVRDVYNVHVPKGEEKPTFDENLTPFEFRVHPAMKSRMFYI